MTKGALLFAFNSPKFNYYDMAVATAKRINHFLNLPVTIVTNEESLPKTQSYTFDKVILAEADKTNKRTWGIWINKGRFRAFAFSPYDETLLIDTDYMVNSNSLLKLFEMPTDFCCYDNTSFLMSPNATQEFISTYSVKTLWATVVMFKKTNHVKQIFECLEMVQNNFSHYGNMHGFVPTLFRNDYALTLAVRMTTGHLSVEEHIIPWNLLHVEKNVHIYHNSDDEFNTEYTAITDVKKRGKPRKEYLLIKDTDFHVLSKENFMELIS